MASVEELPLTGYVGLIVFLTAMLFPPLRPLTTFRLTTLVLTLVSLALTWSQMILYLVKSYSDSAARAGLAVDDWSARQWLGSTDLFDEAWGYVCATPERWWWSSQICLETVGVWLPFLWSQGRRKGVAFTALFMVLGETVAISFAAGLFILAFPVPPPSSPSSSSSSDDAAKPPRPVANGVVPTSLLFALVIGQAMTHAVPSVVGTSRFLVVLGLMHLVIIVPLLPLGLNAPPAGPPSALRPRLAHLFIFSSTVSAIHYFSLTFFSLPPRLPASHPTLPSYLVSVLRHHPAQSSVSWDVVCFPLVHLLWSLADWRSLLSTSARLRKLRLAKGEPKAKVDADSPGFALAIGAVWALTPVVGPAATLAGYMAWSEQTSRSLHGALRRLTSSSSS